MRQWRGITYAAAGAANVADGMCAAMDSCTACTATAEFTDFLRIKTMAKYNASASMARIEFFSRKADKLGISYGQFVSRLYQDRAEHRRTLREMDGKEGKKK